jgi:hypothetical protein
MKAMDAERAALLASQPGPNTENAITPMAVIRKTKVLNFA